MNATRSVAERLDPELKERNAQRRALQALKDKSTGAKVVFHKNARQGGLAKPSKNLTDSARFFKDLQRTVIEDIATERKADRGAGEKRPSARTLKL